MSAASVRFNSVQFGSFRLVKFSFRKCGFKLRQTVKRGGGGGGDGGGGGAKPADPVEAAVVLRALRACRQASQGPAHRTRTHAHTRTTHSVGSHRWEAP